MIASPNVIVPSTKSGAPSERSPANAISVGIRIIGSNELWKPKFHLIPLKRWPDAKKLFGLVNAIVELQITQAKHIDEMSDTIVPDAVKAQIEKRDAPKQIEKKKEG